MTPDFHLGNSDGTPLMIVGNGIDVIEVERIRQTIDRHGKRFLDHVFTEGEQDAAPDGPARYTYYAGRWAAKEAVSKALGTGIGESCYWTDIHVARGADGRPEVTLTGRGAARAETLGIANLHISISHERNLACAQAIAEKHP